MSEISYERLKEIFQAERRLREGLQPVQSPVTVAEASTLALLMLTLMYDADHEDWQLGLFIGFPEETNGEPCWEYDDGPYYDDLTTALTIPSTTDASEETKR